MRVAASIKGEQTLAMVDSGASKTIVDTAFARRLGLVMRSGFDVDGITAATHGQFVDDLAVTLGDLTLTGLAAGTLDLSNLSPGIGRPINLVLGRDIFRSTLVDIDFSTQTLSFLGIDTPIALPSAQVLPLSDTQRGTPHIPTSVAGRPIIEAGFDLGYNAALLVSPRYVDEMGLAVGKRTSTVESQGVEGPSISTVFTVDSLAIGNVVLSNVPVEAPASWDRSIPAIIGLEVFKRFHLTTDYPRKRLWLSPIPQLIQSPLPKDRSGIGAAPQPNGLRVVHVARGSPAERAGLVAGDRITKIDGEPVDANYIETHPRMGTRPAGTPFTLTLADGRTINLILAEYY